MTGATFPEATRSTRALRSSSFGVERNVRRFWLTKGDVTHAWPIETSGPIHVPPAVPLFGIRVPFGLNARLQSDSDRLPTLSRMKSYSRSPLREVLLGVVDHMIGAEAADQVCLSRAAHCGDLGSHRFGDLDGVYADAPSGTVDEDRLPRLDLADVTNGLEGCQTGHRQHRGLLESEAGWFRNELALLGCGILGERALAVSEDLITRFEA